MRGWGFALYTSNAGKPSADLYTGKNKRVNKFMSYEEDYKMRIRQEETHTVTKINEVMYMITKITFQFFF